MTRRYAAPSDFKQALEAQIRRRAQGSGLDIARVRQRCVFERFLARIEVHFGDRATVKGGVVLALRLEHARVTRDVDLGMSGAPDRIAAELPYAGRLATDGDFLVFVVEPDPDHPTIDADAMLYQGRRFRVEAQLAGKIYGSRFGLDVAIGERMALPAEILNGSDAFAFAGIPPIQVRAYAREVHVAEKLHALTLPRSRPNSRVKDLPDIALLATTGPFRSDTLRQAIEATFAQRGTHALPTSLGEPPELWRGPYGYMAQENRLPWGSLDEVSRAVQAFLDPVLRGDFGVWNPESWSWLPGVVRAGPSR